MKTKSKIVFLTLDGFSKTGGIQSVCKSLAFTLNSISTKSNNVDFTNLSLYDDVADYSYIKESNFHGYRGNRVLFSIDAFKQGLCSNTIIISHINLIFIALIIKLLNRKSDIVMLAHGTEIWRNIQIWKLYFIRIAVNIWSVSEHTKDILVKRHNIKPLSIEVLYNCLDPFRNASKSLNKPEDLLKVHALSAVQPIIISVCRMSQYDWDKGYDLTLCALPKIIIEFPNIHYFMIGCIDPSELTRVNTLIASLNIQKHVTLLGYVSDFDLTKYYRLADLFVLPSSKEGFGLVFIEAASFGCEIISGDQDGSKEALMNGSLGISIHITLENLVHQIAKSLRKGRDILSRRSITNKCFHQYSQRRYESKVKLLLR
ncbi:MAG: glycosyltransferase [Flavobacterium sp.]|nr:MAG: glycosyltransferase [Flavobacterium sp.]